jgi:hypothetical protein
MVIFIMSLERDSISARAIKTGLVLGSDEV